MFAAAATAAPTPTTTAALTKPAGAVLYIPFFHQDEDFNLTYWEDAVPHGWDAWMNTAPLAPCGSHHMEYEPCPDCLYLEAQESLWRAFKRQQGDAYDASLTCPEGDNDPKLWGVNARVAKKRKNAKNAARHHAKVQWCEKRRVAREDPSSAPIGVKADRYPEARHQKRANARQRYGPVNHQAQRQRDVDERFALVDGHLAEEDDWFTLDDLADEKEDDRRYLPFGAYVPFAEAGVHSF